MKCKSLLLGNILLVFGGIFFVLLVNCFQLEASDILPACVFHKYTGLYCPGCGCTRAVVNLAKGKILTSLYYNPTILYTAIISIWASVSYIVKSLTQTSKLEKLLFKYNDKYIWVGLTIMLGIFVVRNMLILFFGVYTI